MDIFFDDLQFEEMDFRFYYDENGEPEEIDEMESEQLKNIISNLDRQIKMLPEHYNVEIWEEYRRVCKATLREIEA